MSPTTETAYQSWDDTWRSAHGRAAWLTPEPDVLNWATRLRMTGQLTALDLGCGVGRHALALAALGYNTCAYDASQAGLAVVAESAAQRGLSLDVQYGTMTELPFPDASFDYVVSWNVIYHGDEAIVEKAISEILRVLRPSGFFQGTLLSKRQVDYGVGTEISKNTFVNPEGGGDKSHPHYFCSARELTRLLAGFELLELCDVEGQQGKPGNWHWHFMAERHKSGVECVRPSIQSVSPKPTPA